MISLIAFDPTVAATLKIDTATSNIKHQTSNIE